MRVILAGQRSFGAAVLDALLDASHTVVDVWAPGGNDRLATVAAREGLPCARSRHWDHTAGLRADLIVAAHSHAFLGRRTRNATALGAIGYHPSLLPRHRGRDAVRWTVHMRDPVAGGSVYWMTDSVDAGPIAAQRHVLVDPTQDHHSLWRHQLFPLGVELILGVLSDLDRGVVRRVEQDERCATWEPSWDRPPLHRPELPEIGPMPTLNGKPMRLEIR